MSVAPSPGRKLFLKWLTYLFLAPLMALWTAFCGTLALLVSLWDKPGRQQHTVAQMWAKGMLALALSPIEIIHPERLQQSGGAVYACNHLSYMDTPALFGTLPFQFRILANHYLFKYPFAGGYLARSGQVPGLMRGVRPLREGMPLLLFPDGSRAVCKRSERWGALLARSEARRLQLWTDTSTSS